MQKGFIFPSLYIYLGFTVAMLIILAMLKVQTSRLESCKTEYKNYVSTVAEMGRLAEIKVKAQEESDKQRKSKADEDLRKLKSVNADLTKRVLDNARSSFVPSTGSVTGKPEIACFNQSLIDGVIKRFADRVTEITEQGQSAVDRLNNAVQWANN